MCLYTNNKQFKKEIKKEIPITRALRAIKYLGTFYLGIKYFAKEAKKKKNVYTESYKKIAERN